MGATDTQKTGTARARFEREAQVTAALRSPHTIELYDFGVSGDGTFYYVMELLDGLDLQTLVEEHGPQPPERVVKILRQACHSLHEAHLAGITHRDIKPANIFLCRYGTDLDFVKVLDFGLVKHLAAEKGDGQLTQEGVIAGTPAFLPPEMGMGQGNIDGQTDLYALGCVAYWLLSGQLVFEQSSSMAMVVSHARDVPPPLSERTDQALPEGLERIVMRCLEKEPANRPANAKALADALEVVEIVDVWTPEREKAWWDEIGG
jgi:serine/threonine-protein kinase